MLFILNDLDALMRKTADAGSASSMTESPYFAGCTTEEEVKRRYRKLAQIYHPDSGSGNAETFETIAAEYERLLKKFQ